MRKNCTCLRYRVTALCVLRFPTFLCSKRRTRKMCGISLPIIFSRSMDCVHGEKSSSRNGIAEPKYPVSGIQPIPYSEFSHKTRNFKPILTNETDICGTLCVRICCCPLSSLCYCLLRFTVNLSQKRWQRSASPERAFLEFFLFTVLSVFLSVENADPIRSERILPLSHSPKYTIEDEQTTSRAGMVKIDGDIRLNLLSLPSRMALGCEQMG